MIRKQKILRSPTVRLCLATVLTFMIIPPASAQEFPGPEEEFRFVAYGDSRSNSYVHDNIARQINSEDPELVIHVGDLWDGYSSSEWKSHFTSRANLNNLLNNNRILVARGNHESEIEVLSFSPSIVKNNSINYSFLAGNVFFVCLGMNPSASYLESQLQRAEAQNADFRVIYHHYPVYSGGSHGASGNYDLERICDEYNVTISFAGHDHHYERSQVIYDGYAVYSGTYVPADIRGTTYVVTGGAGAPLYSVSPEWWTDYIVSTHQYCIVDSYADRLEMTVKDENGSVIDFFVREKSSTDIAAGDTATMRSPTPGSTLRLEHGYLYLEPSGGCG